jgi:hypothetical protein
MNVDHEEITPPTRASHFALLTFILLLFLAVVVYSSMRLSPAFDEPIHIRAGMALLTGGKYVDTQQAWWTEFDPLTPPIDVVPALFARWSGEDPDFRDDFSPKFQSVRAARIPSYIFGALTILVVFFWSRKLWGPGGALVSAACIAVTPIFIAHSSIVGTDLPGTFGGLIAALAVYQAFLESGSHPTLDAKKFWMRIVLAGLAAGFAMACKLSNVVFLLVLQVAAAWAAWMRPASSRDRGLWIAGGALACVVGFVFAAILFGLSGIELAPIRMAGREIRFPFAHTLLASLHRMLILKSARPPVFFFGEIVQASPKLYLAAFFIKTPVPLLILFSLAIVGALKGPRSRGFLFVALLTAALTVFFATRGFYLGLRHMLLPIVLLTVIAGAGVKLDFARFNFKKMRWMSVALLAWAGIEGIIAAPWHLSYFNPLTFGRMALVDSDGDWGEGLLALAEWQRENTPNEPIWLAYFGNSRPDDFGISYCGLLAPYTFQSRDPEYERFRDPSRADGIVAISRTQLGGTYMPAVQADADFYAKWREIKPDEVVGGTINIYDMRNTESRVDEDRAGRGAVGP